MKAVIMAGGEGTRLRPLTAKMPKPLTPILGESAMSHIIRLLKKHDISDTAVTLMFMPEKIKSKYGGNFEGVNLSYYEENIPLGTAGSVRNASQFLLDKSVDSHSDYFLVISGDAICDTDLSRAENFHKKSNADVTIVLTASAKPLEFGGVLTQNRESGKIITFIEKPSWSQVFTDTINTGIYIINNRILELIPENKFYDFGKDLFPAILRENFKLFGYIDNNYWCDVGDLDAYFNCNMDAVDGKIEIVKQGHNFSRIKNGIFIGDNSGTDNSVKISSHSIIGGNCIVNENSVIERSIIHDGVKIGRSVTVKNAVICENVEVGDNAYISEGCVIGQDCVIGSFARTAKGVKIWNGKTINKGETVMSNMVFSGIKQELFDDDGIKGQFNETLSPEYCVKIGSAIGAAASDKTRTGRVGIMYSQNINLRHRPDGGGSADEDVKAAQKNNISKLIRDSLLCGVVASGAKSYDFGEGFESLASFAAGHFRLDAMLFVDRVIDYDEYGHRIGSHDEIKIFDQNTLNPSRPFERKLESTLSRDDYKYPVADKLYETEIFEGLKFLYFSEVLKASKCKLDGFKITIQAKNQDMNRTGTTAHIIKKALTELSAEVTDSDMININDMNSKTDDGQRLTLTVSDDGLLLQAYDKDAGFIDFWHIIAVLLKDAADSGETEISVPYAAPHALQIIAEKSGADLLRYLSCAFDDIGNDIKAKSKIMSQLYLKDACFAAVRLCSVLHSSGKTLGQYIQNMPKFASKVAEVKAEDGQKTKIMRELNSQLQKIRDIGGKSCSCSVCRDEHEKKSRDFRNSEGIRVNFLNGFVHVIPKRVGGFKLIAEAVSSEMADEMLHATDDRIKSIIEKL